MNTLKYTLAGETMEITDFHISASGILNGLDAYILSELYDSFKHVINVVQVTAGMGNQPIDYWLNLGFDFLFDVDDEYLHLLSPTESNLMYKVINGPDCYKVCYGKV